MDTMISGYTKHAGNLVQAYGDSRSAGTENAEVSFARTMQERGADGAAMQGVRSPQEMSMEEYRQYIAQKIRQIPVHPSRRNEYISVTISEEGYAAMKNDPEYEAWVLNDLRSICSRPGFCFGSGDKVYTDISYGATKEECHTDTWTVPTRSASDRARERREENRRRLAKRIKKQKLQKQLREIAFQRQQQQRALVKKLIRHRQEMEKENRQRWKKTALKDKPDGSRVLETTMKQKTIEKITERDVIRVEEVLREMQFQQEMIQQRFFEDGNFYGFQMWLMNG
ncbi:MAG: hypothetical protein NC420_08595 [Eubacterium sp.]|nr:hypothetical protein [Eubacterium sp.]MCM1216074.1 hypothetical protein [Lachnospiraceae bacterium]MCM1239817.1 hypothetical protein [Lachnospiraceae bacterium]